MDVGITGLGLFLPEEIRTNAWWDPAVVASWPIAPAPPPTLNASEGARRVLVALSQQEADPFRGAKERRVMPDGMTNVDMEEAAARAALHDAGLEAHQIDALLTHSVLPDYLLSNPATTLHHRINLPRRCIAMPVDAAAYSFMMQLTVAEALLKSGRATNVLLVQSCSASRFVDYTSPWSPLFGDGAAAAVVGRVSADRGILSSVHFADGRFPRTLIGTVKGGNWNDLGPGTIHVEDERQMREVFLGTADVSKEGIDAALGDARVSAGDIDFFAMYQGTPWLRPVVQEYAGLTHARSLETFATTGYLFSAILPVGLSLAKQQGLLHTNDLVLMSGGGTGITFGSVVMRWGS